MNISARWFQVTGVLIGLQFILGVLVSGLSLDPLSHELFGLVVLFIAAATMVATLASKASSRALKAGSGVLVLMLALQVPLGFATLESSAALMSALHIVNAIAIMAVAFACSLTARRWDNRMRA